MKYLSSKMTNNNGLETDIYEIVTSEGMRVSLMSLGAAIQKIAVQKNGELLPLTLGFDDLEPYAARDTYAGATLAPNAGRIRNAEIPMQHETVKLIANEGRNQLHGGSHNLSAVNWNVEEIVEESDRIIVIFTTTAADGVDGYPGDRRFMVKYTITDDTIDICLKCESDRPTYVNMSNHTYWNLSGDFTASALEQDLHIEADNVWLNNEEHIPVRQVPVDGTTFDFRDHAIIRDNMEKYTDDISEHQLSNALGYNNAFILNHHHYSECCALYSSKSNIRLQIYTDAPCLIMYSGGYLNNAQMVYDQCAASPSCAIAFEAQDHPDVVHSLPDMWDVTGPDKPFHRRITFKLDF